MDRNDSSKTILELTSAGKNSEITEVLPSTANEVERDSSISLGLAVDGQRSSQDVQVQSLPSSGEQEGKYIPDSLRGQKIWSSSRLLRRRSKKKVKRLEEQTKNGVKEKRGAMMIVSVLIATLTYQASLNPPGGFWQDDKFESAGNSTAAAPVEQSANVSRPAGTAINSNFRSFQWFLMSNTVGLFASLVVILLLTSAITVGVGS
ncbi:uncharacterized protein LOC116246007 [Nymphaea colorata]|uniref:uncharacterized protein LOC116246007 n=1 Tax=Nymphaea colorata TaxID=210225 RepID=UPI00129D7432|nr:uncharacterized protein LOC116246007 [Nymphaea colorata]